MGTGSQGSDAPTRRDRADLPGERGDADPRVLILLRHGQSTWNLENLFTGWHDVPLSPHGVEEAVEAGRQMKEAGLAPGVLHTSLLVRAIDTAQLALAELG